MHTPRQPIGVRTLRWICVLPVTALCAAVGWWLTNRIGLGRVWSWALGGQLGNFAAELFGSMALAWFGIALGCKTAPSHRRAVYCCLALSVIIFNIPTIRALWDHFNGLLLTSVIGTGIGIIGAAEGIEQAESNPSFAGTLGSTGEVLRHPLNLHALNLLKQMNQPVCDTMQPFLQLMDWWKEENPNSFRPQYGEALDESFLRLIAAPDQKRVLQFFTESELGEPYDFSHVLDEQDPEAAGQQLWENLHQKLGATLPDYHGCG